MQVYSAHTTGSKVAQTVRIRELSQYNVFSWGNTNAYPEVVRQAVLRSPTASACTTIMRKHVYGAGFSQFENLRVNQKQSLNRFWLAMAEQLSLWNAVAVHCTIDEAGNCTAYHIIPFDFIRNCYGEDHEGEVAVWNNWNGQAALQTGNTQPTYYKLWHDDPLQRAVIVDQCGGVEKFSGFVRILNLDHAGEYPTPVLNPAAMTEAMAEAGATERRQALAKNGFAQTTMAFVGTDNEETTRQLVNTLQNAQGSANAGTMAVFSGAMRDVNGKILPPVAFGEPPAHNSEGALNEEARASHNIRNAYGIPKFMLSHEDSSLFAQSGEAIKGAFALYNQHTALQRDAGEEFVNELLQELPGAGILPYLEVAPLTFDFNTMPTNA